MSMSKLRSSLIGGVSALALMAAVGITTPAAAGEDWSGFYVGANVGYGEAEMEGCAISCPAFDSTDTILLERLDPGGLAGGAHAGFNFQVSEFFPGGQDLIIGIEGDVMFLDWQDRVLGPPDGSGSPTNDFATADIDLLASIRARLGILTDTGALIYLTGGIAFVQGEARRGPGEALAQLITCILPIWTIPALYLAAALSFRWAGWQRAALRGFITCLTAPAVLVVLAALNLPGLVIYLSSGQVCRSRLISPFRADFH